MEDVLQEKYDRIRAAVLVREEKNPVEIAERVMEESFVSMHGPEHHFLDGAAFLAAYRNAGGAIDLETCLDELAKRAKTMPGAMCGYWGVCGSVASVGAALSVLHRTGPLSTDAFYGDHMAYAAEVLAVMSQLGGARCCKRNAFLALTHAARFVAERYGIGMEWAVKPCSFSARNQQCLGARCPFHAGEDGAQRSAHAKE